MKKSFAIILGLACLLPLSSCFKTEDDLFSESPAQRLNKLSKEYKEVLCGAEDGWALQYFASEYEQGYPMVVKFDENSGVTIAAKNATATSGQYAEESSTYSFVQDMSVVLSFDTYNPLLHVFADPMPDGVGHMGDYEFQIQRVSENSDTVFVKGKKYGIEMRLIRFPMGAKFTDAAGAERTVDSWESYFEGIEAVRERMLPGKLKVAYLTAGGHSYRVTGLSGGVFEFLPFGGNPATQTEYSSYIPYIDGTVSLAVPYGGAEGEISVQNFVYGKDGILYGTDKDASILSCEPLSMFFVDEANRWRIDRTSYDAGLLALDGAMDTAFKGDGYGEMTYVQLSYNVSQEVMQVAFKSKKIEAYCYYRIAKDSDNGISLSLDMDAMRASTARQVKNAVTIYDTMPAFKAYVDAISGAYTLAGNSKLAATEVVLAGTHSFKVDMQ